MLQQTKKYESAAPSLNGSVVGWALSHPTVLLFSQRGRAVDPGMQQLMQAAGVPASHGQPPPTPDADAAGCADSPLRFDLTELAGVCLKTQPQPQCKPDAHA